jgi:hypothetical protein
VLWPTPCAAAAAISADNLHLRSCTHWCARELQRSRLQPPTSTHLTDFLAMHPWLDCCTTAAPTRALTAASQLAVQHPLEADGMKCQPQVCITRPDCAMQPSLFGAKCVLFSITAWLLAKLLPMLLLLECTACVIHDVLDCTLEAQAAYRTAVLRYSSAAVQRCCFSAAKGKNRHCGSRTAA